MFADIIAISQRSLKKFAGWTVNNKNRWRHQKCYKAALRSEKLHNMRIIIIMCMILLINAANFQLLYNQNALIDKHFIKEAGVSQHFCELCKHCYGCYVTQRNVNSLQQ